ncbi:MAG TPA: condensation domain-containing protein, partial [Flavitalea sp.]|nr:condensation domain-containing protein [Flavitalea sp.]
MNRLSLAQQWPELNNYDLIPVDFDPFAGPEIESLISVTASQSEIWLACSFGGEDAERSFNDSSSIRFVGQLDKFKLERSVKCLIERHESLRSTFSPDGKTMCIHKDFPFNMEYHDLTVYNSNPLELLQEALNEIALRKFDLQSGPLFRSFLYKVSYNEYQLVINTHHIICDGWSTGVIIRDLSTLYNAFVQDKVPDIVPAGSFYDFALQQNAVATNKSNLNSLRFWSDQFKTCVPDSRLPTDFPRPAHRKFNSDRVGHTFDSELVSAIQNVGAKAGASLVTTVMSAFEILLNKLSGEQQIVIGLPTSAQSATGNCRLVGHCVNFLPVLSTIGQDESFSKYLKVRKEYILDALDNQQVTFYNILNELKLARDPARSLLVQVVFNADRPLSKDINFYGLEFSLVSNPSAFGNYEIFLNISRTGGALNVDCTYNIHLYRKDTVVNWLKKFEQILKQIVLNQDVLIADIDVTGTSQAELLPEPANRNVSEDFRILPVHELITAQSKLRSQNTAMRFGNTSYSYSGLEEKSNQFARFLLMNNVRRGDLVGLCVDRSPEMVFALIGILKAGAAYIPLDLSYPAERINYMLTDSGARFLVISSNNRIDLDTGQLTCLFIEKAFQDNEQLRYI